MSEFTLDFDQHDEYITGGTRVSYWHWLALMQGQDVVYKGVVYTPDDGPFIIIPDEKPELVVRAKPARRLVFYRRPNGDLEGRTLTEEQIANSNPIVIRGGKGSGHHGHKGRPGEVGGSLPSGAGEGNFVTWEQAQKWDPAETNLIDMSSTSQNEAVHENLQRYFQRTGITPDGIEITDDWLRFAEESVAANYNPGKFNPTPEQLVSILQDIHGDDLGGAYITDQNFIFLNTNKYWQGTPQGNETLYHELTHWADESYHMSIELDVPNAYKSQLLLGGYPPDEADDEYFADLVASHVLGPVFQIGDEDIYEFYRDDEGRMLTEGESRDRAEVMADLHDRNTNSYHHELVTRGGKGSGHHGHKGRKGKVGGSLPSGKGVTHPIRPPKGKKLVSLPTGQGKRRFSIISDEDYEAIRTRTSVETTALAMHDALFPFYGEENTEQLKDDLTVFLDVMKKYGEKVRPTGGWMNFLRQDSGWHAARLKDLENGDITEEEYMEMVERNIFRIYGGDTFLAEGDPNEKLEPLQSGNTWQDIARDMGPEELMQVNRIVMSLGDYNFTKERLVIEQKGLEEGVRWANAQRQIYELSRDEDNKAALTNFRDTLIDKTFDTGDGWARLDDEKADLVEVRDALTNERDDLRTRREALFATEGRSDKYMELQEKELKLNKEISAQWEKVAFKVEAIEAAQEQIRDQFVDHIQKFAGTGGGNLNETFNEDSWLEYGMRATDRDSYTNFPDYQEALDLHVANAIEIKRPVMNDGVEFVENITNADFVLPEQGIEFLYDPDDDGRAKFSEGKIWLEYFSTRQTVGHELGHYIEDRRTYIGDLSVGFLLNRYDERGGEPERLRDLKGSDGYREDEIAVDGLFDDDYAAKLYYNEYNDDYRATEILSMGISQLYENAPKFAMSDPEYFDYVIGVLTGRYTMEGAE